MARSYVFRLESKRPLHEIIRAVEELGLVRSFREDTGSELQPVPKRAPQPPSIPRSKLSEVRSKAGNARSTQHREKVFAILEPLLRENPDLPTWRAVEALNKSDVKPWKGPHWTDSNAHNYMRQVLDHITKP